MMEIVGPERDKIFHRLRELQEQLVGISPKLALHQKIKDEIEILKRKVGNQGESVVTHQKRPKFLYPKNARFN